MENIIIIAVLFLIIIGAATYIYKFKKRGGSCIGCPNSKQCKSKSCSCGSSNMN